MKVTTTPNVNAALRADPVAEVVIEQLRKDARGGYLHLHRSSQRGPFAAEYHAPDGTRYDSTSTDLVSAMWDVLRPVAAA